MPSLSIAIIVVVALTAAFISRKNKDRMSVCLFWLSITLCSFLFESTVGADVSEIDKGSELYLWATSAYYIVVAIANFTIIYYITLCVYSDYDWLTYPILLVLMLNIFVGLELIFAVNLMDPNINEINMSQYLYKYRYINKGYRFLAEYINDIEILLLVVDNHGNRTRIKQFVASWITFVHTLPTGQNVPKVSSKEER